MKLSASSRSGTPDKNLTALFERQVGFALGRFEPRIHSVRLRLDDVNGPKGGIDKHCRITVRLRTGGTVTAEVTDVAFEPAIHRAVERIARRVQRHGETDRAQARTAAAARKFEFGVGD